MDLKQAIDTVRHLDKFLGQITQEYGTATYAILAAVVFCETGLVVLSGSRGSALWVAGGIGRLGLNSVGRASRSGC